MRTRFELSSLPSQKRMGILHGKGRYNTINRSKWAFYTRNIILI